LKLAEFTGAAPIASAPELSLAQINALVHEMRP
jgi:hypothetical protein